MFGNSYLIHSDLYKNFITDGFSNFQKNEEFVDMTIAAEGYLVKVHKNLIALASPYVKEMLHSASCSHPILFLNNVSHKILYYLLEYIYTGEVQIPKDMIDSFIETGKMLCIKGIENIVLFDKPNQVCPTDDVDNIEQEVVNSTKQVETNTDLKSDYAAHITINSSNYQVNVNKFYNQDNQQTTLENGSTNNLMDTFIGEDILSEPEDKEEYNTLGTPVNKNESQLKNTSSCNVDCSISSMKEISRIINIDEEKSQSQACETNPMCDSLVTALSPQYTVSNKGAIQLMLNRYLYYCHHQSNQSRKRRWRCVDYRRVHCPAFIDTYDDRITKRTGIHTHEFHDNKIMKKFKTRPIYTSISNIKEAKSEDKA